MFPCVGGHGRGSEIKQTGGEGGGFAEWFVTFSAGHGCQNQAGRSLKRG